MHDSHRHVFQPLYSFVTAGITVPDNAFLTYMAGQFNHDAASKFHETKGKCVQYVKLQSGNHYAITDWNPDTAPHQVGTHLHTHCFCLIPCASFTCLSPCWCYSLALACSLRSIATRSLTVSDAKTAVYTLVLRLHASCRHHLDFRTVSVPSFHI